MIFRRKGRYLGQRVGAGIAVVRSRELLLVKRRDNGLWDIPGGLVNPGEEVWTAAQRELTEETGLRACSARLLGVFSGPLCRHTYPDGNVVDFVTVLYQAAACQGEPRAADDAARLAWWPLDALPSHASPATGLYLDALREASRE